MNLEAHLKASRLATLTYGEILTGTRHVWEKYIDVDFQFISPRLVHVELRMHLGQMLSQLEVASRLSFPTPTHRGPTPPMQSHAHH